MSETEHLSIQLMEASQSQKHITVNEALLLLDVLMHLAIISMSLSAPPASPTNGDRYLIAASPSGVWAGHAGELAFFQDGVWRFAVPKPGWRLWSLADDRLYAFDGVDWRDIFSELQDVSLLGVNATADVTNRLAVSSDNVLFSHEGADIRLYLNKQTVGDTASIVLQNDFSGRAEIGLTGDDDLHVKVSGDGSAWNEALTVDRASGAVALPEGSVTVPAVAPPAAPAAGWLKLFAQDVGGRALLTQRLSAGRPSAFQPFLGQRRVSHMMATGGATLTTLNGAGPLITAGSTIGRAPSSTSLFASARRIGFASAAAAGSSCGLLSHNGPVFWRGNATGLGGFHAVFAFGVSDAATVANARMFAGLQTSGVIIGNVNPSSLLNVIGIGCDAGETTLRIMANDGSGAATRTDLGANFPSQTLSADWFELVLFAAPNDTAISWRLTRLNTGDVASGTLSSDLPGNAVFLAPQVWRNNGATALSVAVDIGSIYVETEY